MALCNAKVVAIINLLSVYIFLLIFVSRNNENILFILRLQKHQNIFIVARMVFRYSFSLKNIYLIVIDSELKHNSCWNLHLAGVTPNVPEELLSPLVKFFTNNKDTREKPMIITVCVFLVYFVKLYFSTILNNSISRVKVNALFCWYFVKLMHNILKNVSEH